MLLLRRLSLVVFFCASNGIGIALDTSLSDEQYSFEDYVQDYSKSYSNEDEYFYRQKIWEENRDKVRQHNNLHEESRSSYTLEMNMFADMLDAELPTGYDKSFHPAWNNAGKLSRAFLS